MATAAAEPCGHRCSRPAGHPSATTLCRCRCGATTTRKDDR